MNFCCCLWRRRRRKKSRRSIYPIPDLIDYSDGYAIRRRQDI